jgi:hypothetical protein
VTTIIDRRIAAEYKRLRSDVVALLSAFVSSTLSGEGPPASSLPSEIHALHHKTIMSFVLLTSTPISSLNQSIHGQARTFVLWTATALSASVGLMGKNLIRPEGGALGGGREKFRDDRARAETMQQQAAFEEDPFDVSMKELLALAAQLRSSKVRLRARGASRERKGVSMMTYKTRTVVTIMRVAGSATSAMRKPQTWKRVRNDEA